MKKLLKISNLLLVVILFSFTSRHAKKVIFIDAGHGGLDFGAHQNDLAEKDIVLQIAKNIKNFNENENIEIVLSRDSDTYPSLKERTDFINILKPNMVISLHVNNSLNTEKKGPEIYAQHESIDLAKKLSKEFGNIAVSEKNLHMLRESKAPTMLLEIGFLSNDKDREYMMSQNGQTETAKKILNFINEN